MAAAIRDLPACSARYFRRLCTAFGTRLTPSWWSIRASPSARWAICTTTSSSLPFFVTQAAELAQRALVDAPPGNVVPEFAACLSPLERAPGQAAAPPTRRKLPPVHGFGVRPPHRNGDPRRRR